jgi:hypothetical protein
MPKLTKRFVDALKAVEHDTLYRDDELKGFALRAKPSGARTWVVQYRNAAGRTRKLALGRVLGCSHPTKRASGLVKPLDG